jgi:uroporphyrinogen decarboxylase
MNSRQRIHTIIARGQPDRCGFWLGDPHEDTWPIYLKAFNCPDGESLRRLLHDDFRWISPHWTAYQHPSGKKMFDLQREGKADSSDGLLAHCTEPAQVDDFGWPDPDFLDFSQTLASLDAAGDVYRASGFWCPFFHQAADLFGMQNYFIKMYTHPQVVHAATRKLIDFYLEANARFYAAAGSRIDALFFGNDFGTQNDLFIHPRQFDEFVGPYFKELTDQAHTFGYQVILHSCGSIYRVIPRLIEMGVDALHPLQALAKGMDAQTLGSLYRGKIAFIGGIDTQNLLVNATPEEVKREVRRVSQLLGPHLVVSPSHEALLPDVPPQHALAMAEAAAAERTP